MQGSTDGSTFTTMVASAGYTFDPSANGNTVTINFSATTTRYVRLNITANTAWPAGQIGEFEVYGPSSGDTTPPSAPANLAYTQNTLRRGRADLGAPAPTTSASPATTSTPTTRC